MTQDWGQDLYDLAVVALGRVGTSQHGRLDAASQTLQQVHLLRVPKASSTSMSAVARRLVGCRPPGPCCKYPGDPWGSCPNKALFMCEASGKVVGCTDHYANPTSLRDPQVPTVSMMREPTARSVSAFFYGGAHNTECSFNGGGGNGRGITSRGGRGAGLVLRLAASGGKSKANGLPPSIGTGVNSTAEWVACLHGYAAKEKYRDIVTRMLHGHYAYADTPEAQLCNPSSNEKGKCDKALAQAVSVVGTVGSATVGASSSNVFMGVSELYELSLLLMHVHLATHSEAAPPPDLREFRGSSGSGHARKHFYSGLAGASNSNNSGFRKNPSPEYAAFKARVESEEGYLRLFEKLNPLDSALYLHVCKNLCSTVHELGMHKLPVLQRYWTAHFPLLRAPTAAWVPGNGTSAGTSGSRSPGPSTMDLATCELRSAQ